MDHELEKHWRENVRDGRATAYGWILGAGVSALLGVLAIVSILTGVAPRWCVTLLALGAAGHWMLQCFLTLRRARRVLLAANRAERLGRGQ